MQFLALFFLGIHTVYVIGHEVSFIIIRYSIWLLLIQDTCFHRMLTEWLTLTVLSVFFGTLSLLCFC